MAMSQRTPSATSASLRSTWVIASLRGRVAVVELEGIGPAGEVGVPAVGQDERAAAGLHLPVIVGLPLQVGFAPLDVELGVLLHPGMIRGGVVGDEVHEELKPSGLAGALSG